MISFFAEGIPKPQPRARARRIGRFVRMYNPDTADAWKGDVAMAATLHRVTRQRLEGTLGVNLSFLMPVARSNERKKPWTQWCRGVGDVDNLAKAVLDALVDCEVIVTDMDVVDLRVKKRWQSHKGGPTGCQIEIYAA